MPLATPSLDVHRLLRRVRRRILARRRVLAATLLAVSVAAGVRATTNPPPPTTEVTVAARDLPTGVILTAADVTTARVLPGAVPDGLARDPLGHILASPLRRGEPVTDVRLVGPGLLSGEPGLVATPVRLPDAAAVALLSVGDRIDLMATDPAQGGTNVIAMDGLVLALPHQPADAAGPLGGRLVLMGIPAGSVEKVADAAVQRFLSFAFSD